MISPDLNTHSLNRFVLEQSKCYEDVLYELHTGKKQTHWMWFIFPQIAGLGDSERSRHFAIRDASEAILYLNHPLLGTRLKECANLLVATNGLTAAQIFGHTDAMKFRSCLTLFDAVSVDNSLFRDLLTKYFDGQRDDRTVELLDTNG